jgi:hypothetical protein
VRAFHARHVVQRCAAVAAESSERTDDAVALELLISAAAGGMPTTSPA